MRGGRGALAWVLAASLGCGKIIDLEPDVPVGPDDCGTGVDAASDAGAPVPPVADGSAPDGQAGPQRVTQGLVALYVFDATDAKAGGRVADVAGIAPPVELVIEDQAATTWSGDGLLVSAPGTRVSSESAPKRIFDACTQGTQDNGVTVEAWVTPTQAVQTGPARVVTYAVNTSSWNFVLGVGTHLDGPQDGYVLRVTAEAAKQFVIETGPGVVTTSLQHVVGTAAVGGKARIYVDGVVRKEADLPVDGDFSSWRSDAFVRLAGEVPPEIRTFLGKYALVAIYCRALSETEVQTNMAVGARPIVR